MSDYSRSLTLRAGAERVFNFLADPANLPRYVDHMSSAKQTSLEEVEVTAELRHETVTGDAWFRVDRIGNRIQWGAEGAHDYRGSLEITPDMDRTVVELTIHTDQVESDEINSSLETTLERLRGLLETTG